jgi:VWFA-related protein
MLHSLLKAGLRVGVALAAALACSRQAAAQTGAQPVCVTGEEVKALVAGVESGRSAASDDKLREELLKLWEENRKVVQEAVGGSSKESVEGALRSRVGEERERNGAQLCRVLKESGWPTASRVGQDGAAAAAYLLKNSDPFRLQLELLPVAAAALKKGEMRADDFASLVDRVRVRAGMRQLFGTQVSVEGGFLVLYPIEAEAQVEARRKQYGMPPLAEYLRRLEVIYQTPLVKSPAAPDRAAPGVPQEDAAKAVASSLVGPPPAGDEEVVRVESNLVSLNASVYSSALRSYVGTLAQEDFAVFEDGHKEEVSFFAKAEVPFDLVLLLDLSSSTSGKRDLIRQTTRRFIEAARPSDRVAVVTFSGDVSVVAPLTDDREKLLKSVKKIEGGGGTRLWDALKFTLEEVTGPKQPGRRRAVVVMSDGADNALGYMPWASYLSTAGSRTSFADLVEAVRRGDTLIIPIYLDTESKPPPFVNRGSATYAALMRSYENARKTMALLAEESGGLFYTARKLEDLDGVYDQVLNDLGKVYSLGYRPANEKRDGSWRAVRIEIPGRPDLSVRARPGYYAN